MKIFSRSFLDADMRWLLAVRRNLFTVLCAAVLSACHSAVKSPRADPNYLRQHHAAAVEFTSPMAMNILFEKLADSASACYARDGKTTTMPVGAASFFLPIKGPAMQVEAKFDELTSSGTIRVFSDGVVYLPMFQIDVLRKGEGAQVILYYADDNKLQRKIPDDVRAWLDGNEAACTFR